MERRRRRQRPFQRGRTCTPRIARRLFLANEGEDHAVEEDQDAEGRDVRPDRRDQVPAGECIRIIDVAARHAVRGGYQGTFAAPPQHTNVRLYGDDNPLDAPGFEAKVKLLGEIDAYVRDKDPRVRQVSVSLAASWQVVEILRPDGESYRDIRPLVRVNISVVAGSGDRQESGSKGYGGREGYQRFIETKACRSIAAEYAFHIRFCRSRPASVISTNSPRLSILHSRRAASPSSTRRSISRDVEY